MGMGKARVSFTVWNPEDLPAPTCARVAVLGRSNVGKSTLLNALVHPQKLFREGAKPGVTRGLIGVDVALGTGSQATHVELVDFPGYGFATRADEKDRARWMELGECIRDTGHEHGLLWLLLADPRREPNADDHAMLEWLGHEPYVLVFTKADQCKPRERAEVERRWAPLAHGASEGPYWVSGKMGDGVQDFSKVLRHFAKGAREGVES